jgi:hypothetical protein
MAFPNKLGHLRGKPSELARMQGCPAAFRENPGPKLYNYPLPLVRHTELLYIAKG